MIVIKKVLIPYWVEKSLQRNNLDLSAVLDYSRVKPTLSIEDLLSLELLQTLTTLPELSTLNMEYLIGDLFTCWTDTANEADKAELNVLQSRLQGYSKEPYLSLFNRITAVNVFDSVYSVSSKEVENYRIVDLGSNVLGLVINQGFFKAMEDPAKKLAFWSEYTKRHSAYMPSPAVSKEYFFKAYLTSLSVLPFQAIPA